jgi:hypothetical protein
MSNPIYRAGWRRDLADECRAIAALDAPSTKVIAGELGMLAYGREPLRQVLPNG